MYAQLIAFAVTTLAKSAMKKFAGKLRAPKGTVIVVSADAPFLMVDGRPFFAVQDEDIAGYGGGTVATWARRKHTTAFVDAAGVRPFPKEYGALRPAEKEQWAAYLTRHPTGLRGLVPAPGEANLVLTDDKGKALFPAAEVYYEGWFAWFLLLRTARRLRGLRETSDVTTRSWSRYMTALRSMRSADEGTNA